MRLLQIFPALAAAVLACGCVASAAPNDDLGIVPQPAFVRETAGSYQVPAAPTIAASSADERNVAGFLTTFLAARGIQASIVSASASDAAIRLNGAARDAALGSEGYHLSVSPAGITISANGGPGLYYGLQTLEQLFAAPPSTSPVVRDVVITDRPSYPWRGVMLDVSRHFSTVPFVEHYIDVASRYKMNIFHWHLTDDVAWRIQIAKYPRLTSYGSCGDHEHDLGTAPCLFYTPAQIEQVVAYAKARYVTVVPEIEMPGHSRAALLSYPELACKPIVSDVLCPSPATFAFVDNVLAEVMKLFPGRYVHTGGDEVVPRAWNASALAQKVMRDNHLADAHALQGWFDRKVENFVEAHGKRMVGWDEIIKGGVSKKAIVMAWHGDAGAISAIRGNDTVLVPDGPLYLDTYQSNFAWEPPAIGGLTTLHDVYHYNTYNSFLTPQQSAHIIGVQANLWAEFVPTPALAWYRTYPRLMAVAELGWTPQRDQNFRSFVERTSNQYPRLDADGVNYHIPDPIGLSDTVIDAPSVTVTLRSPVPDAKMYYTIDGTYPTAASTPYAGPVTLDIAPGSEARLRVLTILANGRVSTPAEATYARRLSPGPTTRFPRSTEATAPSSESNVATPKTTKSP
jgi:hexosaminidase